MHQLFDSIGIECGTYDDPSGPVEVIGLLFPNETTHIDGEFETKYITLPAAKALLIDLKDALEESFKHANEDRGL